ncbi:hypothetical protein IJI29_03055 [Candidatus Saccharibacteria bacterium]|nr:hypothetical protein [Candidatus Saccharibacteria bacterium]
MYFNSANEVRDIAKKTGCAVFVMPDSFGVEIKNAIAVSPDEKTVITVEQIREVAGLVMARQTSDRYIIIRPAEKLSDVAANAFLKNLEEPNDKVHYILITNHLSKILPTILSRAEIYLLKEKWNYKEIEGGEKEKMLAKKLIAAKSSDLVSVAEEIASKKNGVREYALEVVRIAIEMLYKTYFMTEKEAFIKKLPKFLDLYDNLEHNGHIKLHIVADLC